MGKSVSRLKIGLVQMRCEKAAIAENLDSISHYVDGAIARGEDFRGGGNVFAPGGQRVYATQGWQPGAAYLEIDLQKRCLVEIQQS